MNYMHRNLVVDDSHVMHSMFKFILPRSVDCELLFANNGAEALKLIASADPDLIFLDINMPVMDGLECLRRLRELGVTERKPVVIVTTEGSTKDVARGRQGGAREYVTKPFRRKDVLAIVEKYLPALFSR
jgi:two-component system chemotaxis response regulator CheY